MNPRGSIQAIITAVFLLLILSALIAGVIYTFAVGTTPQPVTASTPAPQNTTLPPPGSIPVSLYPDQVHITDAMIIMCFIIVAIIVFGISWGWQDKPKAT